MEHFLKGLNELIPDNLLSIFDENELEVSIFNISLYINENGKTWKRETQKNLLKRGERSVNYLTHDCRLLWSIESLGEKGVTTI